MEKQEKLRFTPGSYEAVEQGCICPIIDNNHGKGYDGRFITYDKCPLHGCREKK